MPTSQNNAGDYRGTEHVRRFVETWSVKLVDQLHVAVELRPCKPESQLAVEWVEPSSLHLAVDTLTTDGMPKATRLFIAENPRFVLGMRGRPLIQLISLVSFDHSVGSVRVLAFACKGEDLIVNYSRKSDVSRRRSLAYQKYWFVADRIVDDRLLLHEMRRIHARCLNLLRVRHTKHDILVR